MLLIQINLQPATQPGVAGRGNLLGLLFGLLLEPPPVTVLRVTAVTAGYYNGVYYEPGDVFDVVSNAFANSSVNYAGVKAGTQQYGWMAQVAPNTPLLTQRSAQPIPLFPLIDPTPPRIFVY